MRALDFHVKYIVLAAFKASKTFLLHCDFFFFFGLDLLKVSVLLFLRLHIDYKVHLSFMKDGDAVDLLAIMNHQIHIKLCSSVLSIYLTSIK